MKDWLDWLLNNTDHPAGRATALFIQVLIVLSLIAIPVQTLPNLAADSRNALRIFEIFVVVIFTVEYLCRVYAAERARDFVFSFWGLVDLAAILPFYIASGLDLRALRAFRFLRLIRILKLGRYSNAAQRLGNAFASVKEELVLFGAVSTIVVYLAGLGIYHFEHEVQPEIFASAIHSLWWAIVTLTTVGYGDAYPITAGGKLFTTLILIVGLGVVAVPTALIASALGKATEQVSEEAARGD